MVRLLRIALIWLLALALPAQGYAACEKTHQYAALAAQVHDHAAMTAHDHGALADQATGHGAHEQRSASGIEHHDSVADHQVGKAVGGKCSVCAACCSVTAIAMTVLAFDVVPSAPEFGDTSLEHRGGVTTGGLDRPPRIVHA